MTPEAAALRMTLAEFMGYLDFYTEPDLSEIIPMLARILVRELKLAEPEMHVPNALAHKLLPLLELAREAPRMTEQEQL